MATTYPVSLNNLLSINYENVKDNCYPPVMNEYLNQEPVITYLKEQGIKRGDIIEITEVSGFRNDGLAIWDGNKVQELATEPDDYGTVPPTFFVGEEFLTDHWEGHIFHNQYVWVKTSDPSIKQQILDNLTPTGSSFTTHMGTFPIVFSTYDIEEPDEQFLDNVNMVELLRNRLEEYPNLYLEYEDVESNIPSDGHTLYLCYY